MVSECMRIFNTDNTMLVFSYALDNMCMHKRTLFGA